MKPNRRNFMKMLLPLAVAQPSIAKTMSEDDELRCILFNSPHLFRFRAEDGHRADVWVNNVKCDGNCTEFVGSPEPDKSVRGAVCLEARDQHEKPVLDTGRIVTKWKIGIVRWMPLVETSVSKET